MGASVSIADTICFTGHRPDGLFGFGSREDYKALTGKLERIITELYQRGFRRVVTGGAQGTDQLAFWAAVKAKKQGCPELQNSVFLPSPTFGLRWPENGLFSQRDFRQMLPLADDVHYVCADSVPFGRAADMRNRAMVDRAGMVVGVCTSDQGGTANCLRYALRQGRSVAVMHPQSLQWIFSRAAQTTMSRGQDTNRENSRV